MSTGLESAQARLNIAVERVSRADCATCAWHVTEDGGLLLGLAALAKEMPGGPWRFTCPSVLYWTAFADSLGTSAQTSRLDNASTTESARLRSGWTRVQAVWLQCGCNTGSGVGKRQLSAC